LSALVGGVSAPLGTVVGMDIDTLTPRERDVLARIAGGATNPGIAAELWLSVRTVESHVASIFSKLRLPTDAERRVLAALAYSRVQSAR
jgi:DNA-binding NarL/FixJ family response regulator